MFKVSYLDKRHDGQPHLKGEKRKKSIDATKMRLLEQRNERQPKVEDTRSEVRILIQAHI
jgi:hypothetical protein